MRRLVVMLVGLVGCTDDVPQPTAAVTLVNLDGVPLATWPVVFQGDDGRVLDTILTDAGGRAVGPMEPDGMVTWLGVSLAPSLETRGGVQPGDEVRNAPRVIAGGPTRPFVASVRDLPAAAGLCEVSVVCDGATVVRRRGVPGANLALDVPRACATPYVLATATDNRYEVIAHASFDAVDLAAPLVIDRWRTDFTTTPITVSGLMPDLWRYTVDTQAYVGDVNVAQVYDRGDGGPWTVTSAARLPAGLTGSVRYRFVAMFWDGEVVLEQRVASPSVPFVAGPRDVQPRMTSIGLVGDADRPTITFTTKHPLDTDPITVDAVLVTATGASWTLRNMPGPYPRVPEVPTALRIIGDLVVDTVSAHSHVPHPDGEIVRTTAMPYSVW